MNATNKEIVKNVIVKNVLEFYLNKIPNNCSDEVLENFSSKLQGLSIRTIRHFIEQTNKYAKEDRGIVGQSALQKAYDQIPRESTIEWVWNGVKEPVKWTGKVVVLGTVGVLAKKYFGD